MPLYLPVSFILLGLGLLHLAAPLLYASASRAAAWLLPPHAGVQAARCTTVAAGVAACAWLWWRWRQQHMAREAVRQAAHRGPTSSQRSELQECMQEHAHELAEERALAAEQEARQAAEQREQSISLEGRKRAEMRAGQARAYAAAQQRLQEQAQLQQAQQQGASSSTSSAADNPRTEQPTAPAAKKAETAGARRRRLQASLPPEPQQNEEGVVSIRVHLPSGSGHARRWLASDSTQQLANWVESLEAMPLWEHGTWQLVTRGPRQVIGAGPASVSDLVTARERALTVFVERL